MESLSTTTATIIADTFFDLDPIHTATDICLRMEDVDNTASASPAPSFTPSLSQTSPAPVVVQSKQAKKRKSWGQELPEPKTALPPRKRAKTDDEKEQRRIERIKRNRAAAHNSRERKRQETETLAVALAHANAKLQAYHKLHGPLPTSIVLPEVHLSTDGSDEIIAISTPAPSLVESQDSHAYPSSPVSPSDSIFHSENPPTIKTEPLDNSDPLILPPAFDSLDSKSSLLTLDPTQHSAAMLCDLQCRSSTMSNKTSPTFWWNSLFLRMMAFQLHMAYRTILVGIWTISPSRMARWMQASALRSTSRSTTSSTTLQLLRSTPRCLALSRTATGLRAPREGALALQRQSPDEVRRSREDLTARQAQAHHTEMALSEQVTGTEDAQGMGDDGEENGVRRNEFM